MNKTITASIIVAVILVGGYFFFRGAPQPAAPVARSPVSESLGSVATPPVSVDQAPAAESNVVITYTDAGYSPATLQVKKGEVVTFKNQSARSMWTASAAHPTHRAYPTAGGCLGSTFDACAGVQPGASWSFQFDIAGTWKYHNHLSPGDTGMIVVK